MLIKWFQVLVLFFGAGVFVLASANQCRSQVIVVEENEEQEENTEGCYVTVMPGCINAIGDPIFSTVNAREQVACSTSEVGGNLVTFCSRPILEFSWSWTYSDTADAGTLGLIGNTKEILLEDVLCGLTISCECLFGPLGDPPVNCKFVAGSMAEGGWVEQKKADVNSPICPVGEEDDDEDVDGPVFVSN